MVLQFLIASTERGVVVLGAGINDVVLLFLMLASSQTYANPCSATRPHSSPLSPT
jgi:hypothetical protein